jgi:hypothetical protein
MRTHWRGLGSCAKLAALLVGLALPGLRGQEPRPTPGAGTGADGWKTVLVSELVQNATTHDINKIQTLVTVSAIVEPKPPVVGSYTLQGEDGSTVKVQYSEDNPRKDSRLAVRGTVVLDPVGNAVVIETRRIDTTADQTITDMMAKQGTKEAIVLANTTPPPRKIDQPNDPRQPQPKRLQLWIYVCLGAVIVTLVLVIVMLLARPRSSDKTRMTRTPPFTVAAPPPPPAPFPPSSPVVAAPPVPPTGDETRTSPRPVFGPPSEVTVVKPDIFSGNSRELDERTQVGLPGVLVVKSGLPGDVRKLYLKGPNECVIGRKKRMGTMPPNHIGLDLTSKGDQANLMSERQMTLRYDNVKNQFTAINTGKNDCLVGGQHLAAGGQVVLTEGMEISLPPDVVLEFSTKL